jgi:hypothetical protein
MKRPTLLIAGMVMLVLLRLDSQAPTSISNTVRDRSVVQELLGEVRQLRAQQISVNAYRGQVTVGAIAAGTGEGRRNAGSARCVYSARARYAQKTRKGLQSAILTAGYKESSRLSIKG